MLNWQSFNSCSVKKGVDPARPFLTIIQYEGGQACGICGHVITAREVKAAEAIIPTVVIPGFLYLGNYDTSSRAEILKAMAITHILNVRVCCNGLGEMTGCSGGYRAMHVLQYLCVLC